MATLRVKESFSLMSDPSGRVYCAGDLVDSSDPVTKKREHLFEPAFDEADRRAKSGSVETATAAPGEKRSVSPAPAKKATKAAPAKKES